MSPLRVLALLPLLAALGGCNLVVMAPSGDIAAQQRDLIVISTVLMLLIIVPVMALTVFFAWRYRASNTEATYKPDWNHSTGLELVIWAAPLLIIIALGALTWMGTHLLDPYRKLDRIAAGKPVPATTRPLEVEVVALDWKWLFIYPEQGIATVNELAAPVDRPIHFKLTSSSVMNSFYIPALAGQIYAMPAMQTRLHAVINRPGRYQGFSANYSGAGFSGMRFSFLGMSEGDFEGWVAKTRESEARLDRAAYLRLERPSENVAVQRFGATEPRLFDAIRNLCVQPGKMCMSEMMALDAKGGLGLAGLHTTLPLAYDKYSRRGGNAAPFGEEPRYIASICTVEEANAMMAMAPPDTTPRDLTPIRGLGLAVPPMTFAPLTPRRPQTFTELLGLARSSQS
ncbi:MAG TPA: ubiquinol oxidase subunit II [Bosea sp. (in: a-proteobacteria)]|uniref:ubiquinol oxidase subunit II n=1 Tax=Bosea sp. (in: a-proteobacteria) TaxID=1871050 RepID=UPI002DDCAFB6|nr:ubiquinol oxidase subunit II [Bosea sp. (in: a-proteobacteria)]HEV2553311.1 ubiquinol oxidase subunit II [Bosea sp. (in: a-proteobacteria)]